MTRFATLHQHYRRAVRLVALLLALLMAVSSLAGHAAMEADAADCVTLAQMQHHVSEGSDDDGKAIADVHHCSVCAAVTPRFQLALSGPVAQSTLPAAVAMTVSPHPPQRPPRT